MPDGDPFERWLNDFHRDVDASLERSRAPELSTPEARDAQSAFDDWWVSEQRPLTEPAPARFEPQAPPSARAAAAPPTEARAEPRRSYLPQEWPVRLEKLADERARLQQRSEGAEREAASLRERLTGVQAEIAALEAKLSRARVSYEEHIARLEEAARAESGKLEEARSAKAALEAALKRAQEEQAAVRADVESQRARADGAEQRLLDARRRLDDCERRAAELEKAAAAQDGALAELRRQSSVYSQRLVQAKEVTDSDVMTLRQDLKTFLEELRLLRNSIRKGE